MTNTYWTGILKGSKELISTNNRRLGAVTLSKGHFISTNYITGESRIFNTRPEAETYLEVTAR